MSFGAYPTRIPDQGRPGRRVRAPSSAPGWSLSALPAMAAGSTAIGVSSVRTCPPTFVVIDLERAGDGTAGEGVGLSRRRVGVRSGRRMGLPMDRGRWLRDLRRRRVAQAPRRASFSAHERGPDLEYPMATTAIAILLFRCSSPEPPPVRPWRVPSAQPLASAGQRNCTPSPRIGLSLRCLGTITSNAISGSTHYSDEKTSTLVDQYCHLLRVPLRLRIYSSGLQRFQRSPAGAARP